MHDFGYLRPTDLAQAAAVLAERPDAQAIAGGTDLINLMKDGITSPGVLVDINRLGPVGVTAGADGGLEIGALTKLSDVASDPRVRAAFPVLVQALEQSASPQLRNMASVGGNLLQRTRCPYFRSAAPAPCNKRLPGSGCSARDGDDRSAAIFGWSTRCVAVHPSDLAVALAVLDARIRIGTPRPGRATERTVAELYRLPGERPDRDTELAAGELVTAVTIPSLPSTARSAYVKVRERASYDFALVSCAVALEIHGAKIRWVRIALGGVAARPWRLSAAERELAGFDHSAPGARLPDRLLSAVAPAFAEARPPRADHFKVTLAQRAVVRALARTLALAGAT